MSRARGDLRGVGYFEDFAAVHHGDAGGEVADDRHGMGDEEVGEAEVALELREEVDDLGADADVEGGDGLVADDELGPEGEGTGDSDPLALASGELVRIAGARGFVEADGAEEFGDAQVELRSTGQPGAVII